MGSKQRRRLRDDDDEDDEDEIVEVKTANSRSKKQRVVEEEEEVQDEAGEDDEEGDENDDYETDEDGGDGDDDLRRKRAHETPAQRRALRMEYRKLQKDLVENREVYIGADDLSGLVETLEKAEKLHKRVTAPQEGILDSRILILAADVANQRATNMRMDSGSFSIDEFVVKLGQHLQSDNAGQNSHDDDEDGADSRGSDIQWDAVGSIAKKWLRSARTCGFMLGPLEVKAKERAQVQRQNRKLVIDNAALQKPKELKDSEIEEQKNETANNVQAIYAELAELSNNDGVPYWRFVVNPRSFAQTVENVFYVAFLVREGKAEVFGDEPMLRTAERPTMDEVTQGVKKRQAIVDIDVAMWKELIRKYNISKTMIPHREEVVLDGSRWYG
ncbi:Nse4 C-terminal-domain-containing protein [Cladochytrium replicatum]|nr:Nse4 C-terminal-domain-containing protein [Cladochytrium replicatum]